MRMDARPSRTSTTEPSKDFEGDGSTRHVFHGEFSTSHHKYDKKGMMYSNGTRIRGGEFQPFVINTTFQDNPSVCSSPTREEKEQKNKFLFG